MVIISKLLSVLQSSINIISYLRRIHPHVQIIAGGGVTSSKDVQNYIEAGADHIKIRCRNRQAKSYTVRSSSRRRLLGMSSGGNCLNGGVMCAAGCGGRRRRRRRLLGRSRSGC